MSILIVDDEENERFLAQELLTCLGRDSVVCKNGMQAIDAVKAEPDKYALILMDVHMPVLNGVSTVAKLKGDSATRRIPVLALTSDFGWLVAEEHTKSGFDGACLKPLDFSQLAQILLHYS